MVKQKARGKTDWLSSHEKHGHIPGAVRWPRDEGWSGDERGGPEKGGGAKEEKLYFLLPNGEK